MAYRNFIYLKESELDKPIYRIFPIGRFIQILTTKQLTLVKPKKWDDPFENALLCSAFQIGGDIADFAAKDSVYGQCWTLHRETDAMWRIYSPSKDGVRLMTTPRKLLKSLQDAIGKHSEIKCFIGKVKYEYKSDLEECFSKIDLMNTNGSGIAESLLYKRKEFSHEREVRLIYSGDDGKCESDILSYPIDPDDLFDRVLFDPRMEESLRKSYISAIRSLGCNSEVKRSTLYDAPKSLVVKLNS